VNVGQQSSLQLQSRNLTMVEGSAILHNRTDKFGSNFNLKVTDSISIIGVDLQSRIRSGVYNIALSSGQSGKVTISANQLLLQDGGIIGTGSYGMGKAGDVAINVSDTVQLKGNFLGLIDPVSRINSVSFSTGDAGNMMVSARRIIVQEGGAISTSSLGTGNAGNLSINSSDSVLIDGVSPLSSFSTSSLQSNTFKGNAGKVTVNTAKLTISGGGTISTTTGGNGNAGSIVVNASEGIEIYGSSSTPVRSLRSMITSSAVPPSPLVRMLLRLPVQPSGNSGDIMIHTDTLRISNGGAIDIQNEGTGDAGTLFADAELIALSDQGRITASTKFGGGGNVNLRSESLRLRQGSSIITTANNKGNAGNINISAPIILGLENSDVVANALQGRGGNVQITTQGIIGLKYRDRLTPKNDITASSEFGVNGTVQVNTIGVNPSSGLAELPVDTIDPSQKIATGCAAQNDSSFVATGRGGVPENPMQVATIDRTWSDLRSIVNAKPEPRIAAAAMPIEATALATNAQGQIELIGVGAIVSNPQGVNCSRQ
jgi:large exoprotein involved in heme utilization and adhesion